MVEKRTVFFVDVAETSAAEAVVAIDAVVLEQTVEASIDAVGKVEEVCNCLYF